MKRYERVSIMPESPLTQPPPLLEHAPTARDAFLAKFALGLAILSCPLLTPLGPLALTLGIIAHRRATRHADHYGGRRRALAAIWLGAVATILLPVVLFSMSRAQHLNMRSVEAAKLRAIGQACSTYASRFGTWPVDLAALTVGPRSLLTPKDLQRWFDSNAGNACDYTFIAEPFSGDGAGRWIVVYADPKYFDGAGAMVLFADSHAEFVREPVFSELLAKFKTEFEAQNGRPPNIIPPR